MGRSKEPLARTLSKQLGLTITQTVLLLEDPERFITDYIAKLKVQQLKDLPDILDNMRRIARTGKTSTAIKAAELVLKFTEVRSMKNHSPDSKNHISAPVQNAVKWLPGPTVDAKIVKQ